MPKLTKKNAPTEEEQKLFDEFIELCDKLKEFSCSIPIGSKFGYGGNVVWITYKSSRVNTKWIYVYPEDYRLHNHHDMYFWSITIESQKKVLQVLRDKLIEYENNPGWLKIRENYRKRQARYDKMFNRN